MKNDHKITLDIEIVSTCAECGRPIPVKVRHSSSYGAGLTVEIDTQPHTCPVFCEVCGDEIVDGGHKCEGEKAA